MCVIYQTTEDDADDTIVPRSMRADGDREKLIIINEKEAPISFDDARIEEAIKATGAKLLILYPLASYIGDCQLNAANEVRPRFNHLIRIAQETNAATGYEIYVHVRHQLSSEGHRQEGRGQHRPHRRRMPWEGMRDKDREILSIMTENC